MDGRRPGVPAGTTTRFVLLIASVLATGAFAFTTFYAAVPATATRLRTTLVACEQQRQADPDLRLRITSLADLARFDAVQERWQHCVIPTYLDEAAWVGYGGLILLGLAGLLYLLHPWWIRRRRRSEPLLPKDDPGLARYLDGLCAELAVPPPGWLVAPDSTVRGLTFGLPGRRRVQLNAGLITRYTTDRAEFRAVVLHELAHLRNRDVDKTYLAIGIWWAFVATALIPMAALAIQPRLLYDPSNWQWSGMGDSWLRSTYLLAVLAFLGALVYLTRNAILRVRETHADAVAATRSEALRGVVERLRPPRGWWSALGTHPGRAQRLAAITNPDSLLRPGLWELAGIGLAAAVLGTNFSFLLDVLFIRNRSLGRAPLGLLVGALMVGMLMVQLWRASAAGRTEPVSPRTWLAAPAALVAGFTAGDFVSLKAAITEPTSDLGNLAVVTLILFGGLLLITGWALSTIRTVLARHRRWLMPAVVGTAVVATAPWFTAWFIYQDVSIAWQPRPGDAPDPGGSIGWYSGLSQWVGVRLPYAVTFALENPLTLPGLTLLWLVPVLVLLRDRRPGSHPPARVGFAAAVGLAGGLIVAVTTVVLPPVAKALLPAPVRALSASDSAAFDAAPFPFVYDATFAAVAVLIAAGVAVLVATRAGHPRPALILFALSLTTAIATAARFWLGYPVAACVDLYEFNPPSCFGRTDFPYLATVMHQLTLKAALVAVPLVLLAVLVALRFRQPVPHEEPVPARRLLPATILTVTTLLLLANLAVAVIAIPHNYDVWTGYPSMP